MPGRARIHVGRVRLGRRRGDTGRSRRAGTPGTRVRESPPTPLQAPGCRSNPLPNAQLSKPGAGRLRLARALVKSDRQTRYRPRPALVTCGIFESVLETMLGRFFALVL